MMNTFNEIDERIDKVDWCSNNIGPSGKGWSWDFDIVTLEERASVVIKIEDDEMAMAYKLRWC